MQAALSVGCCTELCSVAAAGGAAGTAAPAGNLPLAVDSLLVGPMEALMCLLLVWLARMDPA